MSSFPLHVLIIEPFGDVRRYVRDALSQHSAGSFALVEAASGQEGLHRYREQAPDLLLLSLALPDMDGVAVLEALAEAQETLPLPVVVLADSLQEDVQPALAAGAHAFIARSEVGPETLGRAITIARGRFELVQARDAPFHSAADSAPVLLWIANTDKARTFFNKRWLDFTGRTMEEEVGTGWLEGVHPDDRARCLEIYDSAFAARRSFEMEYRLSRHDGVYRWVLEQGTPHVTGGSFLGYTGSCVDVSERKQEALNQRFLGELDVQLRQLSDADEVIRVGLGELGRHLGLTLCTFNEVDVRTAVVTVGHTWPETAEVAGAYSLPDYLVPAFVDVARAGQTHVVENTATDPRTAGAYEAGQMPPGIDAFLAVPYLRDGVWSGLLVAANDTPRYWHAREVALVEAVATRLWTAMERAAAEEAWQASAEQLSLALEAAQLGAWDHDLESDLSYWDERCRAILGFASDEPLDHDVIQQRVHPDDRRQMARTVQQAVDAAADGLYSDEYRVVWPDGAVRWVTARGQVYFDGTGEARRAKRFVGTLLDVTERRQAEDAMRESEQRFRSTFEQAAVGISHVALDGSWVRVNQRLCDIVGYSKEELSQKTFQDITHPDDLDEDLDKMRRLLAGEIDTYAMEKRYFRKDGSIVWINLTVSPVRDAAGEPLYMIAVIEEISDRKAAEETLRRSEAELRALNATLEERVRAGTRQVRALASELTLAEQRERRRIARILHDDVQQMLYALQLHLHLMENNPALGARPSFRQQLLEVQRLAERIGAVNRSLTVELSPPVLYAEGLVEALEWLVVHLAENYGLRVTLRVYGDCRVPGDDLRELIFQLIRELLLNVVRHAGVRRARLEIRAEDDGLVAVVADEGAGFDVTRALTERKQEGGGLGLFTVQERLDLFGGKLKVDSRPGKGTRATIRVPLVPAAAPGG